MLVDYQFVSSLCRPLPRPIHNSVRKKLSFTPAPHLSQSSTHNSENPAGPPTWANYTPSLPDRLLPVTIANVKHHRDQDQTNPTTCMGDGKMFSKEVNGAPLEPPCVWPACHSNGAKLAPIPSAWDDGNAYPDCREAASTPHPRVHLTPATCFQHHHSPAVIRSLEQKH